MITTAQTCPWVCGWISRLLVGHGCVGRARRVIVIDLCFLLREYGLGDRNQDDVNEPGASNALHGGLVE
jgi:hypothetical protein